MNILAELRKWGMPNWRLVAVTLALYIITSIPKSLGCCVKCKLNQKAMIFKSHKPILKSTVQYPHSSATKLILLDAVCGLALSCWYMQGHPWKMHSTDGSICCPKTCIYFQHWLWKFFCIILLYTQSDPIACYIWFQGRNILRKSIFCIYIDLCVSRVYC